MNYYYITGTSRGIGKALAEKLLEDPNNKVIGLSRSRTIKHQNYLHVTIDFSKITPIKRFRFEKDLRSPERIVLVNNAGTLGEVKPVGKMNNIRMVKAFNINLIAPAVLMNQFMSTFEEKPCKKLIINISSGAGKYPVDGWGLYCSTKAGLDLYSKVIDLEQDIHPSKYPFRVFSISPGIVDTEMQDEIREKNKNDFTRVEEFRKYKKEGDLVDPGHVAEDLYDVIQHPDRYEDVLFRLKGK